MKTSIRLINVTQNLPKRNKKKKDKKEGKMSGKKMQISCLEMLSEVCH